EEARLTPEAGQAHSADRSYTAGHRDAQRSSGLLPADDALVERLRTGLQPRAARPADAERSWRGHRRAAVAVRGGWLSLAALAAAADRGAGIPPSRLQPVRRIRPSGRRLGPAGRPDSR